MYAVTVTFEIHPENFQVFLPLMAENAQLSLKNEAGCHQFDVCTDPALPNTIFLYEIYDDKAAFDAHLQSPHFLEFDQTVTPFIATKTVRCFSGVTS